MKSVITFILMIIVSVSMSCACPASTEVSNNSPVIKSLSYAKDTMAASDNEISCLASDPDGDSLTYEWSADGGLISARGHEALWISPDTMGEYRVTVTVKDGKGGKAVKTVDVRVLNNSDGTSAPPVTLRLRLHSNDIVTEKTTVKVGTITKVNCLVEDAVGKKISYSWLASGGKLKGKGIEDGTCSSVNWTAPVEIKLHTLDVIARDNEGNEARGQVIFDVFCCPRN